MTKYNVGTIRSMALVATKFKKYESLEDFRNRVKKAEQRIIKRLEKNGYL